jgi:hypothetical protein
LSVSGLCGWFLRLLMVIFASVFCRLTEAKNYLDNLS